MLEAAAANLKQPQGSLDPFDRLARDIEKPLAQHGETNAHRPLSEKQGSPHDGPGTVRAASIGPGHFDVLTKQIETSHRQLAARLEAGLAAAANETSTLKDMIAGAAAKIAQARKDDQSPQGSAVLEREIANLAGRLDRADEGFASLASLEQAIDGLSVQLEETRRITNGLTGPRSGEMTTESLKPASGREDDTQRILREVADLRAFHEDIWQRVHFALTEIQQSVEQIAKATRGVTTLHGPGFLPSSADPFAPILTSLAQHGQDVSLAARVIQPGASDPGALDKEIRQTARRLPPADAAPSDAKNSGSEVSSAGYLIEPGRGFPGRAEDGQSHLQSGEPPKLSQDREEAASRIDFIAAARRAARTAQRELQLQGAAKSVLVDEGIGDKGNIGSAEFAVPDTLLFRSGRSFFVRNQWALILAAALLCAAAGGYALTRTLTRDRLGGFVPAFLKSFDRGTVHAKPATTGDASANQPLASRDFPSSLPPNQWRATQTQSGATLAGEGPAAAPVAVAAAAAVLDLLAPGEPSSSGNGAIRSRNPAQATRTIAGSDAIMADTLGPADNSVQPSLPAAAGLPGTALPPVAAAGTATAQAAPAATEPAKNLFEAAQSGDPAAQFDLAVRYAEGRGGEQNYEMAAQWFGKAAEQGLAVAEYRLATLYERGLGVTQDVARAKNLYQRAAEKGNTRAMHNLGVLAVESPDGKPNYTSAALWFGKAAEYGVRDSQYNFAVLLARGLGLPKDLVRSYTWFAIVASEGDADAAKKRDEVAARLTSSELAAANAAATAFEPRLADRAANETVRPSAHQEAYSPTQGLQGKHKVSGL